MRSINLATLLSVGGGLGLALLPATARANCSPSVRTPAPGGAPITDIGGEQFNPQAEYQLGLAAFNKGDFRRANSAFSRLLPYAPKAPELLYLLGASRAGLGNHKGAVKMLEKAVKLAPDLIVAQRDLAISYAKMGSTAEAQTMLAQLKAKASACGADCDSGAELTAAVAQVQAAMPA
ncbi:MULTISPECIES: tetratricopeptide repeat protein [Sphingomonas]|uniref:tetratricopeptide repeat protein n=1 Tax=Sphingomonas TaxID=13687 RepID=UPI0019221CB8|nr:tetratricopeptide repeat protein [Sphingomonas sp. CCH10-B3]